MLNFYVQLLEQINVASLSGPTVFLQCYSLLLLYFGPINDDDDDHKQETHHNRILLLTAPWRAPDRMQRQETPSLYKI